MSLLRNALGMILRVDTGFGTQEASREPFSALHHSPSSNFTLLNFSSATHREFAGDPNASSPLRFSPPYW
jgi:hypothetical protein